MEVGMFQSVTDSVASDGRSIGLRRPIGFTSAQMQQETACEKDFS